MTSQNDIRAVVVDGCRIVRRFLLRQISDTDFVESFGSYYYAHALDGHESDEIELEQLRQMHSAVDLLRSVQEQALNRLMPASEHDVAAFVAAGRIPISALHDTVSACVSLAALDEAIETAQT